MDSIIKLENIHKSFGDKRVLNGIDFVAHEGELITIKGKSGSGKSTLLNIIGLLCGFDEGIYSFKGEKVKGAAARTKLRMSEIGFIFQAYCLLENLSLIDNILMPYFYSSKKITGSTLDKVNMYIERFGLKGLENKKVKFLSGGERQRAAIIRAIIKDVSLIIGDEPTGNLDPANSMLISDELAELAQNGKTVIIVTHSDQYFQNADVSLYLEGGKLINE